MRINKREMQHFEYFPRHLSSYLLFYKIICEFDLFATCVIDVFVSF